MGGRGASQAGTEETERIESQIESTRAQLASTIDAIAGRVAPKTVAAKAKGKARDVVVNPDGSLKRDRVIKIASIVAVVLAIGMWRRFR